MIPLLLGGIFFVDIALGQTPAPTQNSSSSNGAVTSPNYPNSYPNNYQQRFISSVPDVDKVMRVEFDSFDVEGYPNVPCTAYDYVLLLDIAALPNLGPICDIANTRLTPSYGVFCNSNMPFFMNGRFLFPTSHGIIVEFCSDGFSSNNKGFQYSWMESVPPTGQPPVTTTSRPTPPTTPTPFLCGNPLNLNPGTSIVITSPNYPPGPYPNNALCTWNVTVSNANIHISTTFFDLESYPFSPCIHDYVQVSVNGYINKYCSIGVNVYLASSSVLIQFVSDTRVQRLGFNLTVSSPIIPTVGPTVNPMCGSTYALNTLGDTAMITSPGWPGKYPNNANCSWSVSNGMSASYNVEFLFLTFYTEFGYDKLVVFRQDAEPVRFDGSQTGQNYSFTGSSLNVVFTSDNVITKAGFQIQLILTPKAYQFSCSNGQFKCRSSNRCISGGQRCDGHSDCPDNSDENDPWCEMPNQCGTSQIPPNMYIPGSRIVNGTTAKPGSWPWQVSVHRVRSDGSLFQTCGGSLISPHWIISAAHCFYGETGNPGQFVFKIGSWNKFSMDSPYEVDIQAKGIWIHPHYNPQNHSNDISLIKLATDVPFPFNNHTNGICIPQPGYIVPANTQCVISGWGTKSSGGRSGPFLQQAVVPVVSNSVCGDGNHYQPGQIDGTMICAGLEKGGKDTCQGDSGGPLVCHNPGTGQWVLQGITSWGRGCAFPHYPGVYARVSALTDFIFNTVNKQD